MEGASGDDHEEPSDQPPSKKRYHRHSLLQIQKMEMFFKDCPHPDEQQRMELSKELGLEPRQVKFWFQNRRTQMKAHHERADNSLLRSENERLQIENVALREALKNACCPQCGGPVKLGEMSPDEQQLRVENARLRNELNRVSALLAKFAPSELPAHSTLPVPTLSPFIGGAGMSLEIPCVMEMARRAYGLSDREKQLVAELAISAMDEFITISQAAEPLWTVDGEVNQEEYARMFPRGLGPVSMKSEATRDTGLVTMSASSIIDNIMNADRWVDTFSSIVASAVTTEVLTTGGGNNWNNALQMMYAELQVLSPLVPTRELFFLRYCKQTENTWVVVDVSVGALRENFLPYLHCRLRPSGFLIEEVNSGCSKVTILQHIEADDRGVSHLYRELVNSGTAFGAKRWLATLQRRAERMAFAANAMTENTTLGVIPNESGRQSMLKLAQRMTSNFCAGVGASVAHTWIKLSGTGDDDVRVMTRKSFDSPGEPHGTVVSAATSLWLPVHPQRLFDFLRDERLRSEWDILSNGGSVQAISRVANSEDSSNVITLLRVHAQGTSPSNMLILQESSMDASGSLIVYAPVDTPAMNVVMQGGDPSCVALLPSGFAITPDGPPPRTSGASSSSGGGGRGGSLLTVAFQIIVPTSKVSLDSVATINSLLSCTVQRIKASLIDTALD